MKREVETEEVTRLEKRQTHLSMMFDGGENDDRSIVNDAEKMTASIVLTCEINARSKEANKKGGKPL